MFEKFDFYQLIQGVPEKTLVIVEKLSYLDKEKLRKTGSKL